MEKILDKYTRLRARIKHGDTMLVHGEKAISKIIQEFDNNAYWNHILIIMEVSGVLFCVDSNAPGVHPERLSVRIKDYSEREGSNFTIRRSFKSEVEIDTAFFNVMQRVETAGEIKYDFKNGIKSMLNRRFNIFNFKIKPNNTHDICSMFVYPYELELEMIRITPIERSLVFPSDFENYELKVKYIS
jgi:hypothetical protein